MNKSRDWRLVDEMFHAALERPLSERSGFLETACGDDAALREEISSLIDSDERASEESLTGVTAAMAADWIAEREGGLESGSLLGHYRVVDRIGVGGMGEVYRAQDTSLHRTVALKVLPSRFLADSERTRRFEEEARAASALNHPNIVTIHEIGRARGSSFIVSEFVDGETLRQRIARGALPLGAVLDIAIQTAGALSAAHAAGIVHRDIKSDNLMVRPDGIVKIVDFGIAKLAEQTRKGAPETVASHPDSAMGAVTGTVCYMSPEQALGESVDHRSDIFSLGVVLYEMATGRLPFEGGSGAAVYDAMLHRRPPPASALNPGLPADIDRIISRTFEQERKLRYQSASDLGAELKTLQRQSTGPRGTSQDAVRPAREPRTNTPAWRHVRWIAAAVIGAVAMSGIWTWGRGRDRVGAPIPPVRRFVLTLPSIIEPEQVPGATAVISPDGRHIVYVRGPASSRSLYIRDMDRLDDRPLGGSDLGDTPFFSPDSQWVAFVAAGELRKVRFAGGPPHSIADVPGQRGGSWGPDGRIVIATADGRLQRVSADGGELEVIATPDPARAELAYEWPEVLPDGRGVIFTTVEGSNGQPTGALHLRTIDLDTRKQRRIVSGASFGRYAASGLLLYYRAGELEAVPFDPASLAVTGAAVSLAQQVVGMPTTVPRGGAANFSISNDGTLIYIPGSTTPIERSMLDASYMHLHVVLNWAGELRRRAPNRPN